MNKSIYFEFYKLKTPYFPSRRFPKSRCVNFDASFAQEEGLKSQAGYVSYITTEDIKEKPAVCDIIEFQSVRIGWPQSQQLWAEL